MSDHEQAGGEKKAHFPWLPFAEAAHGGIEAISALAHGGLAGLSPAHMLAHAQHLPKTLGGVANATMQAAGLLMSPISMAYGAYEMAEGYDKLNGPEPTEGVLDMIGGGLSMGSGLAGAIGGIGTVAGAGAGTLGGILTGGALAAAPWLALAGGGLALGRYGADVSKERGHYLAADGVTKQGAWDEAKDTGNSVYDSVSGLLGDGAVGGSIAGVAGAFADVGTGVGLSLASGVRGIGENIGNW